MRIARLLCVAALLAGTAALVRAADTLDIYFIDVEGGQSTLIVTPAGESLLIDTGFDGNDGRDAKRIVDAVRAAGLKQIDYLLITHFHRDHDGGVVELAKQVPIRTFVDHGGLDPATLSKQGPAVTEPFAAYQAVRAKGKHIDVKPNDRLSLKGLEVVIVSSAKAVITKPVAGSGEKNAACPQTLPEAAEPLENPRSTGFHLRFGEFNFVDLGDLTGPPLYSLVCPSNLLGRIDAYLVPHHGGNDTSHPSLVAALQPRVAIMNNGQVKGGGAATFAMLHAATGIEDVWQLHRSANAGARNFPDDRIANLDETTGHRITLSARSDGSFQITNGRTGATTNYSRRATGR